MQPFHRGDERVQIEHRDAAITRILSMQRFRDDERDLSLLHLRELFARNAFLKCEDVFRGNSRRFFRNLPPPVLLTG